MAITAIVGGAVVGGAATLGAGAMQSGAARSAANQQMQMYQQTRSDLLPYMNTGSAAFGQLGNLLGLGGQGSAGMLDTLRQSPGYQWAFNQGLEGVDRSAASRGLLLSGGQLKDVTQYGQGMADQLFNTYAQQLMGASQLGENAAAGAGNQGQTAAANAGMFQTQGAQAMGAGVMGATNSLFGGGGALQNALTGYALQNNGQGQASLTSPMQAAQLGSLTVSDRRAKKNVTRIGTLDSGLPVYSFEYKGSDLPQIGVMADEVEQVAPSAVVRLPHSGLRAVNLRKVSELPPMEWKEAA